MISEADVIVLGGGPAGSAAAISCAQRGLRVLLFERQPFPREHPGETLHPGVEALLRVLGAARQVDQCNFLRHPGHWLSWRDRRRFVPFGADESGPWLGYQAWRADFDEVLLNGARALGVDARLCHGSLAPLLVRSRVSGLRGTEGTFRARYVIDATGARHWLQRHFRLTLRRFSPPLVAFYGYRQGECPELDPAPALEIGEAGWTWMARVRPGLYQWTRLSLDSNRHTSPSAPRPLRNLSPKERVKGSDVTWRLVPACAGPGYFVVGDAAAILDPASSHGVLRALMSGMMAAHLIGLVHQAGTREEIAIECYRGWLAKGFLDDVKRLKDLYGDLWPCLASFGTRGTPVARTDRRSAQGPTLKPDQFVFAQKIET